MSLRDHRDIKSRKQIPEHLRRREGAHLVRTREPQVCPACNGKGHVYDVHQNNGSLVTCTFCGGEGEV